MNGDFGMLFGIGEEAARVPTLPSRCLKSGDFSYRKYLYVELRCTKRVTEFK